MMILPFSGVSSPIRDFRNTDLPVPDGPSSTLTSPGGSVRVTSDQMLDLPNDLLSPSTLTSTPAVIRATPHDPTRRYRRWFRPNGPPPRHVARSIAMDSHRTDQCPTRSGDISVDSRAGGSGRGRVTGHLVSS